MKIQLWLKNTSQPRIYSRVENAYTENGLFCIHLRKDGKNVIYKYPLADIFRIVEES